mmetsp:Transcript_14790/g.50414  ORF Transcript_14790/g.50414 Transcript_14790/m.50414 type:complete len:233 (+) Transcript_14790:430-1128(+)
MDQLPAVRLRGEPLSLQRGDQKGGRPAMGRSCSPARIVDEADEEPADFSAEQRHFREHLQQGYHGQASGHVRSPARPQEHPEGVGPAGRPEAQGLLYVPLHVPRQIRHHASRASDPEQRRGEAGGCADRPLLYRDLVPCGGGGGEHGARKGQGRDHGDPGDRKPDACELPHPVYGEADGGEHALWSDLQGQLEQRTSTCQEIRPEPSGALESSHRVQAAGRAAGHVQHVFQL